MNTQAHLTAQRWSASSSCRTALHWLEPRWALASEMLHDRPVRLAVAAGLQDATMGTDAVRIKQAIEEVDSSAGVVVLMDLGSAVLSAELALDLLKDPDVRERVILSAAPLVEGLVVAAVAAAGGAGRKEVAAEAQNALLGKAAHLGAPNAAVIGASSGDPVEAVATFVVDNRHGLHARPAARLVSEMRTLDAAVKLRNVTTWSGPGTRGQSEQGGHPRRAARSHSRDPGCWPAGTGGHRAPASAGSAALRRATRG